jgi:hypothetical protein
VKLAGKEMQQNGFISHEFVKPLVVKQNHEVSGGKESGLQIQRSLFFFMFFTFPYALPPQDGSDVV